MNFKISSAPDRRLSEEDYQKFKDDYLNSSLTWHELRKKYKLSKKEHSETCKRVKAEEGISIRPCLIAKYFYRTGNSYQIIKRINGVNVVFGTFSSSKFNETDLKRIVETCKEYEWDLDKCKAFIEKVKLDRRNLL